jgi:hypothetical protein
MTSLALALVLAPQQGPKGLEWIAAELRGTGATVQVSNVEDPAWEIWLDHNGPIKKTTFTYYHDIKRLTAIRIFSNDLTDRYLAQIHDLPDLKLLVVISSGLTDDCTKSIAKHSTLTKLDINRVKLKAKGLERLTALKKLERLYLYNAQIGDRDMKPLKKMKWLKLLNLPQTVTDVTLQELKIALPKTEIEVMRG